MVAMTSGRIAIIVLIAVVLFILAVALACCCFGHRRHPHRDEGKAEGYADAAAVNPYQRTIWLLWFQGWDDATCPWLVRQVRRSWETKNPGWTVTPLSDANLGLYLDVAKVLPHPGGMSPAARSDVVRLNLLAEHGGVWADATMLCTRPLDEWVQEATSPVGFWMYHGRDEGRGPASWFIATSRPGTYIATAWRDACREYWSGRRTTNDYFWMDALFETLLRTDPRFAADWAQVPYKWCEDPGEAHMFAGKVMSHDPDLLELLRTRPPYAVKLSHHGFDETVPGTNGVAAINISLSY